MNSIKFENKSLPVYFFKGNETTEQIIALCDYLNEGKKIDVDGQIYQYANLPEFLVVVSKIEGVDFNKVYDKYEKELFEIWNARVESVGKILKR
ncbi:MAG: hypothetical protein IJW42_07010 [Alistipes sp.]|nr:hypothetical protein [Alistipes sp.]